MKNTLNIVIIISIAIAIFCNIANAYKLMNMAYMIVLFAYVFERLNRKKDTN